MSHGPSVEGGIYGYLICLWHAGDWCLSDTDTGTTAVANGTVDLVLSGIGAAPVVWNVLKFVAGKVTTWQFVAKWIYHAKHVKAAPDAGNCDGDFGYGKDVILAPCTNDPHGVYWQLQPQPHGQGSRQWSTYAKGDLTVLSDTSGQSVFVHKPIPGAWEDWGFREICAASGC